MAEKRAGREGETFLNKEKLGTQSSWGGKK